MCASLPVLTAGDGAVLAGAALVVRARHHRPAVQQDLDHLVVVGVGRQDQRRDVRGEGGRVPVHRFPALQQQTSSIAGHFLCLLRLKLQVERACMSGTIFLDFCYCTHPRLTLCVDALLVVQQNLHRLHILLVYGVQQCVLCFHLVLQEQLHHFKIFIVCPASQQLPCLFILIQSIAPKKNYVTCLELEFCFGSKIYFMCRVKIYRGICNKIRNC